MKKLKQIPKFKTDGEEREFWAKHDSCEYVDWSKAEVVALPNLKPTLRTISIRLPEAMINSLKILANKNDVPYQSLLKVYLAERIKEELKSIHAKAA
jgi:predicted DNA binding CopG/RHH family protein